jgi:predicted TIM-barrel fold metal-dependent hydrolase
MPTAREDAQRLLWRAREHLDRLLPADAVIADAHTHLGVDEDGMALDLETLLAQMDAFGVRRALVFPLHEQDRHPGYRAPNDRVLRCAAESDGRLVPLARLDLAESPIEEARRCLELGARGIKLHPRAQAFTVDDDRLEPVFALAEEHRLPVLIHAGRGMPPIGEHLAQVAARHPGAILILAHAAIVDQERICTLVGGRPNVFFDTSTWGVVDIINLLSRVAPEQVLFATDVPYGNHLAALSVVGVVLEQLRAPQEARRAIFGETLEGLVAGNLPKLSEPLAPRTWTLTHAQQRVYAYLAAATPLVWLRQRDVVGLAGLAAGACLGDSDGLRGVGELVRTGQRLWDEIAPEATRAEIQDVVRLFQLAQAACFAPDAASRSYLCE